MTNNLEDLSNNLEKIKKSTNYPNELQIIFSIAHLIGEMFKPNCEVAISDLSKKPGKIIYIYNGSITGRNIGDELSKDSQNRLKELENSKRINYKKNVLKVGKEIKSSTMIFNIKNIDYSFCINYDCTLERQLESTLQLFLAMQDDFIDINTVEDKNVSFIEESVKHELVKMNVTKLNVNKKIRRELIKNLMKKGILSQDKAVATISRYLGVSRYTIYNDIKAIETL